VLVGLVMRPKRADWAPEAPPGRRGNDEFFFVTFAVSRPLEV